MISIIDIHAVQINMAHPHPYVPEYFVEKRVRYTVYLQAHIMLRDIFNNTKWSLRAYPIARGHKDKEKTELRPTIGNKECISRQSVTTE